MKIRQPLIVVLGHVDHGKTLLLDRIRSTAIAAKEAGGITQSIGASIVPLDVVKKICGPLLETLKIKFTIPGLLFIDTPGHAAFTNLRKRGGNLADIAILVVDINEGFKPQTVEALEILKGFKTPFIVAANKIDLIDGWRPAEGFLLKNISAQSQDTQTKFETKLYELAGKLSELGFDSDRFDRVADFTKQIGIVPVSAKTGEGIPELLMVISGLAQKYLEEHLKSSEGPGKGTVLEVKEEKGLGTVLDAIIYDGTIRVNDTIVVGGLDQPVVTKVRALFEPAPLQEMREKKAKFNSVKEVSAAAGVRISAPELSGAVGGMPIRVATKDNVEKIKREILLEVKEILIETQAEGVVIKADSLGSLEAFTLLLKEKGIPVMKASVGNISKKDISDAESVYQRDPLRGIILGFNVEISPEAKDIAAKSASKILLNNVIYRLIEEFEAWQIEERKRLEAQELETLIRPCKIMLLPNYIFRQSNPAIVGSEVLVGVLKSGTPLMNKEGKTITSVKSMQKEQESVNRAEKGEQLAVAYSDVTVGRQINGGDLLYSAIPEEHFRKMKILKKYLKDDEIALLKEIVEIMRKKQALWGV